MYKSFVASLFLLTSSVVSAQTKKLTVYSSYDSVRLAPIFAPFTEKTGIQVEVVSAGSTDLIQRLQAEGEKSPADIYLDKDITFMGEAESKQLLQRFSSSYIANHFPAHLVDSDKMWFLLFYRARTIMYNTQKVDPSELSTYEDLGNEKWKGQLCVRTSNNSYNEALGAFFVKHLGESRTESLFRSWVANFAVEPIKGDTDVIKAIANGTCSVGIANTYYLAPLVRDDASFPVKPYFADQKGPGVHINGVGVGITRSSKNLTQAHLLLEYLASKEVQEAIATGFSQYPSNRTADIASILVSFGPFVEDTTNVSEVSGFTIKAKEIMTKAGYK